MISGIEISDVNMKEILNDMKIPPFKPKDEEIKKI